VPSYVTLSLDIYPSQLKDRLLPARVLRVLQENGLAPQRLELEITESALVADMDNAQTVLGALRNAGRTLGCADYATREEDASKGSRVEVSVKVAVYRN